MEYYGSYNGKKWNERSNDGGFLPGTILLTQCYYHRGTHLHAMKRLNLQPMIPPKRFDIFSPDWGVLRRSRYVQFFLLSNHNGQV